MTQQLPPAGWQPPQWAPPTPPPPPATNVAAIVAFICGLVGMVGMLPLLLGPIAVITGLVGERQARTEGRTLGKMALGGIILGAVVTLIAVNQVMPL